MKMDTVKDNSWICDLAGPLRLREAEMLCPGILQDGAYTTKGDRVYTTCQPDYPDLRAVTTRTAKERTRTAKVMAALDAMRREHESETGWRMDERPDYIPGYARRALVDKDAERFNRLYAVISRIVSKEWRRWMEHVGFWNAVLGERWLGQEDVPEGPAREELLGMLSLRYALQPQRFHNVLPEKGMPASVEIALRLGRMQIRELQEPSDTPEEEAMRSGALAMLQGEWEKALSWFQKVIRTGNTAVYSVSEKLLAPLLVYVYICAIRAGAKRQTIQTWGDILQGILPAFCLRGESEGMVGFLHNLTVLDGIMNRRTMPSYMPDTESDLACLPLALCYDRLSPQLRRKIKPERLVQAIEATLAKGQHLLGYYAAEALAACIPLPEGLAASLRTLRRRKVAPLYGTAEPEDDTEESPACELDRLLGQNEGEDVELLHWEILMDGDTGIIRGLRPRLRTTGEQAVAHELTLNQCDTLCREAQDLSALQLARLLEQGDASALRWFSALAGHPRLRLVCGGRRTQPFVLRAEKPVLSFQRDGGTLSITLEAREDGVLRHVGGNEWAAQIHSGLLDSLRDYFRVRSEKGVVTLPDSATDMVFRHYDRLTRYFEIRGTLARIAAPVDGDCRMVADLRQRDEGQSIRLYVRIHAIAGTDMEPGAGPEHVDVRTKAGIVSVNRDLAKEKDAADDVCRRCGLEPRNGRYEWKTATPAETLDMLARLEQAGVLLLREGDAFRCITVPQERLELHARYMGEDWFELGAELVVDEDLVYTLRELLLGVESAEQSYVPVRNGYLKLTPALTQQLHALKALTGNNGRNFGISVAALPALARSVGMEYLPQDLQERLETLKNAASLPAPAGLQTQLRLYQLQGFRWLAERAASGIGTCLADDMGLGKTIQLIALLLQRVADGPSLVVCPVSLQANWQQELERFAPSLQVVSYRTGQPARKPQTGEVWLVSYGLLVSNLKTFCAVPWNVMALDEAQAIKNPDSQRAKAVCALHAAARVALTGTPVENNSMDLWSLMRFLNPLLLGSKTRFRKTYFSNTSLYPLASAVGPLILRRTKTEVLPQLPSLTEQVRFVQLSGEERAVYESARRNALSKMEHAQNRISILAELTRLRRACCHAKLVLPEYAGPASKLEEMLEVVVSLRDAGHKALVFSQFTDVLDLAEPLLRREGIHYERLDGSTPARQRDAAVKRFQKGSVTVFLISLKAGGTGLNLTAADYVLLLDPWWNPAVEAQAAGRSHRIGQDYPVTLYRFIAADTVEERVLALNQDKKDLADAILSSVSDLPLDTLHDILAD